MEKKAPWNWALFGRTVLAVAGLGALLLGATELGIVLRSEGGRPALGVLVTLLGVAMLAYPIAAGFREALEAKKRGES